MKMVDFSKAAKESLIQRDILKYLNGLPMCKAIKIICANEGGTPDIFCVYRGTPLVLEVKATEQDVLRSALDQKRQHMQMDQWETTGAMTAYVWSLEGVETLIAHISKKL
jgi:Holliday junction resolvase